MNKHSKKLLGLFSRYFAMLLIGAGNLYIFYKILTPLTIHVINIILSIFMDTRLINNIIFTGKMGIEIIPACIAGSAFYLLFVLILSTANIKPKIRIKAVLTAFTIFFTLNIIRILILIPLTNISSFEIIHWIFWHVISTLFVVATWFGVVKIYKIKSIPVYTDLKYLKDLTKPVKKSKRKKKHN